jgi:hypothetical protein
MKYKVSDSFNNSVNNIWKLSFERLKSDVKTLILVLSKSWFSLMQIYCGIYILKTAFAKILAKLFTLRIAGRTNMMWTVSYLQEVTADVLLLFLIKLLFNCNVRCAYIACII